MKAKTEFEKLLKKLSQVSNLTENEILHEHIQTTTKIYRFLTNDLDALDIVIYKNGVITIYKNDKPIKIAKETRHAIVDAIYKSLENKFRLRSKIN